MTTPTEPMPDDNRSVEAPRARVCRSPRCRERSALPRGAGPDHPADEPMWPNPVLRVDDPAEFVAAVPALLGFVPQRSLVVCMLGEAPGESGSVRLGTVARHDLDVSGCGAWARLAGQLAAICVQEQTLAVLVLIVDDRAGPPRSGRAGRRSARHRELLRVLAGALAAEDVLIAEACAVAEIAPDAPWWSLLDPESVGTQTDPAASPVALAHVLDGRPIRTSRAELAAVVAPDPAAAAAAAAHLDAAAEDARVRYERAVCRAEPGSYSRAALEMVLWLVATVDSGDRLEPRELADLAVALRDPTVRDAQFALAVGPHAAAAEAAWTQLCRAVTGFDRAEAATLLGFTAYLRGDGPLAGVALAAALEADAEHGIATLLETALRTGMPPQEVRKLARSGRDKAAALGVDLGFDPNEPGR
ncbi:DUF4192 domain-containing protein [Nocardia sp. NPDC004068]|uniref:DUF4192 domain-containing protein n=1 Tax=Nocardia sp. NPDC004068 TaxID=3364303 RepID=UPI0036B2C813